MELKIEGVDELLNDLQRAGKLNERTWKPLHQAMQESVNQIEAQAKQNVTGNNSIASGELRKGITNEVQYQPHALVGIVSAHAEGSNNYNYAPAVEYGTRPHWPPIAPLVEWAKLKHLAGVYSVKTRRRLGSKSRKATENYSLAYAVQRKIARHGTKPRPFMEPAFNSKKAEVVRLFRRAIAQVAASFGRK